MGRSPWREVENVSAESAYVAMLLAAADQAIAAVRGGLEQRRYFRTYLDRLVQCVAPIERADAQRSVRDFHHHARAMSAPVTRRSRAGASRPRVWC